MDIDFIKWLCEKAEGFEIGENSKCSIEGIYICNYDTFGYKFTYYPLLLQRAIEGVNRRWIRKREFGTIKTFSGNIVVQQIFPKGKIVTFDFVDFELSIDKAKESALEYIYGQETK